MFRLESIAAILAALLFISFVNSSGAIEIIGFPSDTEDTSYNGYTYHGAYVKTDVPIYSVSWSINGKLAYSETLDSSTDYASYYPYDKIPGIIKGKKYKIEVEVWEWDADDEVFRSTTASYTVRMFESIYLSRTGEDTGAQGYAEISRFYYDGSHIIMSSYAYASNPRNNPKAKDPNDNPLRVAPWFWTQQYPAPDGAGGNERRDTKVPEDIEVGETSQYFYGGPHTDQGLPFDRHVGNLEGRKVYYKAHAHLHVFTIQGNHKEDHWEVDTQQQTGTAAVTFTAADGP